MRAKSIQVTSSGPALGEIVSEGDILDSHNEVLATFRQRLRAWWNRPLLEIQMTIEPKTPPEGYAWHAYYGARFAWRDPAATLFRSVNMQAQPTTHNRPQTTEYLEIHNYNQRTALFTGGLPFLQRQGPRMLDVILIPPGETGRTFELALGLDLEDPIHQAMDFISSPIIVPTTKGPPHVGASGWLFHLDAPNVVVTCLRPAHEGDAVVARFIECRGVATPAEFRCPRNPIRAILIDERDRPIRELTVNGDAVHLDFNGSDMQRVRIEFSA